MEFLWDELIQVGWTEQQLKSLREWVHLREYEYIEISLEVPLGVLPHDVRGIEVIVRVGYDTLTLIHVACYDPIIRDHLVLKELIPRSLAHVVERQHPGVTAIACHVHGLLIVLPTIGVLQPTGLVPKRHDPLMIHLVQLEVVQALVVLQRLVRPATITGAEARSPASE